jgi:hypothetical protein
MGSGWVGGERGRREEGEGGGGVPESTEKRSSLGPKVARSAADLPRLLPPGSPSDVSIADADREGAPPVPARIILKCLNLNSAFNSAQTARILYDCYLMHVESVAKTWDLM